MTQRKKSGSDDPPNDTPNEQHSPPRRRPSGEPSERVIIVKAVLGVILFIASAIVDAVLKTNYVLPAAAGAVTILLQSPRK